MKKKIAAMVLLACMLFSLCACALSDGQISQESGNGMEQESGTKADGLADDYKLEDNDTLYEEDNDTSVVTMYLTVSKGNATENTNHTWNEVNSHSVYYYEDLGIDRYAVNGLLQVGDENGPTEGALGYNKYTPNATVQIRGQTSSNGAQKNYKIELKDGMGTWNDQRVINLNKHQTDGVRFRNKLCYDLLEELPGTVALQTQFVHLYVKDETEGTNGAFTDYGLYTQVEQPNKSFLERHGFDKNGQLYKINFFEFFRYEDTIMLKSDADYDEKAFEELLEIKGDDDHTKLIEMLTELNDYSIPIEEIMEKWFDADNIASWMAFQILVGNIDTQSRNTLLYSPQNSNTWYFISWDCDASFRLEETEVVNQKPESGWESGISNYWGNVLFKRLLKNEGFCEALDAKMEEYRAILTQEKLSGMVEAYANVVKPYLYGNVDRYYARLTETEYEQVCSAIPTEIEQNYERYRESFEKPMPFYIGKPVQEEGKVEFIWDNAYDFDNENIFYTFELADDLSFDNPIALQDDLFLPEYIYDGSLKPGQYFVRVKARNESGKEQYAFDYYVSDGSYKNYGVLCFYVLADGSIEVEMYDEAE